VHRHHADQRDPSRHVHPDYSPRAI
jgi:hypothetical protein